MNRQEKVIWAAGFFDGEGCITGGKNSDGHYNLTLSIAQKVEEPLLVYVELFGYPLVVQRRNTKEEHFQFRCGGQRMLPVLVALEPYLTFKRPQALLAIEFLQLTDGTRGMLVGPEVRRRRQEIYEELKALKRPWELARRSS